MISSIFGIMSGLGMMAASYAFAHGKMDQFWFSAFFTITTAIWGNKPERK